MVRALKEIAEVRLVIPRVPGRVSKFSDLNALHLPRVPFNTLSNVARWPIWPFLERAVFSLLVRLYAQKSMLSRSREFEAIYVRDVVVAGMLAPWAKRVGVPLIYEAHHLETDNPSAGRGLPGHAFVLACEQTAMATAAGIVVLTQCAATDVVARWPRLGNRLKVVPDAYDEDVFRPMPQEVARMELGIPRGAFLVTYAGLTFAHRNVDLMVKAAKLLVDMPDLIMVVVGGRPQEQAELRDLATRLALPDGRVLLPGRFPPQRTVLWMAGADALALTGLVSSRASSPLKLFEYMAVGRAIVSVDAPAVREVLGPENALFFSAGDAQGLANCVVKLRGDPSLRDSLGRANTKAASAYTYRARARSVYSFVREIAG
jgi:glycosyltransferase involved in cell wall biosynthesis